MKDKIQYIKYLCLIFYNCGKVRWYEKAGKIYRKEAHLSYSISFGDWNPIKGTYKAWYGIEEVPYLGY